MNRKLVVILLVPMFLMVAVPFSAHASSTTYYMVVACYSDYSPKAAVVSLVFLGHSVTTACHGEMDNSNEYSFSSTQSGTYKAVAIADSSVQAPQGSFNPTDRFAEGVTYGPGGATGAFWCLTTVGFGSCEP